MASNPIKTYIGIDPAFRKDGMAMCIISFSPTQQSWQMEFFKFKSVLDACKHFMFSGRDASPDEKIAYRNLVFCVENSNLQNCTFDKSGNEGEKARKSRNVGANQAISQLICDILREFRPGATLLEVSPLQKREKLTSAEFKASAKAHGIIYSGKTTSQDKRDAYKLALHAKRRIK